MSTPPNTQFDPKLTFADISTCFFLGDSELTDYVDSLARDPDRFIIPHNNDTGETILHLLAKEGKVEILRNLFDDIRVEQNLPK